MANYYCRHCGNKFTEVRTLTSASCVKSPTKKHELYEGSEKTQYVCKYCGYKSTTIRALVSASCTKSPTRYHVPAL